MCHFLEKFLPPAKEFTLLAVVPVVTNIISFNCLYMSTVQTWQYYCRIEHFISQQDLATFFWPRKSLFHNAWPLSHAIGAPGEKKNELCLWQIIFESMTFINWGLNVKLHSHCLPVNINLILSTQTLHSLCLHNKLWQKTWWP